MDRSRGTGPPRPLAPLAYIRFDTSKWLYRRRRGMATTWGPQLDLAFLEDWGERFSTAWNEHDPEAVIALCTEDVQWSDPALAGSPADGKAAVRDFAAFTFQVFPDFRVEERESIYVSWTEPMALCPYRMTGRSA